MLQISKVVRSRDEWKEKATQRGDKLREFRKTQKRHQEQIAALKLRNREIERTLKDKKTVFSAPAHNL